MLNISNNSISDNKELSKYANHRLSKNREHGPPTIKWIGFTLLAFFGILMLPWTQNINAKGYVTTRSPEQRPQAIQSVIAGRLEEWYVQEGDFVKKGDTIVYITEVKSEYFDPDLLERTSEQLDAKNQSVTSYEDKVLALEKQYEALKQGLDLKRRQIKNKQLQAINKMEMDSIELSNYKANLGIAENQYSRIKTLHEKGLKTLSDLQDKEYKVQAAQAKLRVQENKLLNSQNEIYNLRLELLAVEQEYADKMAKSQSEKQSALSSKMESLAASSKLRNQYSNYNQRQKFYYITAPQEGYITKTIKKGIGETLKEGSDIATIMPARYDLAVEIYLKPYDLPLLGMGTRVQIRFDGWPALVISGWPEASTGVFKGEIVAIDRYISDNGHYRVMISPISDEKAWPELLSVGTGAHSFVLLNEVQLWYEIWRQLNGFPADYYGNENKDPEEIKRKAPIKSVK